MLKYSFFRFLFVVSISFFCIAFTDAFAQKKLQTAAESSKYIYLTFDDGPLKGSRNIDSIITLTRVPVSVFVVGQMAKEGGDRLGAIYKKYVNNPYIEIYNHSYSHAGGAYYQFYEDEYAVFEDIEKNQTSLDLKYKIVRLPGRNMWRVGDRKRDDINSGSSSADMLKENGYSVIGWDLEWGKEKGIVPSATDKKNNLQGTAPDLSETEPASKILYSKIVEALKDKRVFTKNHLVLLMHDEMFWDKKTVNQLHLLIELLKKDGYTFAFISNYPLVN